VVAAVLVAGSEKAAAHRLCFPSLSGSALWLPVWGYHQIDALDLWAYGITESLGA
jgi:hypothetical protein